jgi:hypothetical protein
MTKHICKRDLLRNPYQHIGDEPVVGTRYGQPDIMLASISNVANIQGAIDSLNTMKASLSVGGVAAPTVTMAVQNNEKDHSHKA